MALINLPIDLIVIFRIKSITLIFHFLVFCISFCTHVIRVAFEHTVEEFSFKLFKKDYS